MEIRADDQGYRDVGDEIIRDARNFRQLSRRSSLLQRATISAKRERERERERRTISEESS